MESDGIENSQSASIYSCVVGIYSNFIFMRERRREGEKERERKREERERVMYQSFTVYQEIFASLNFHKNGSFNNFAKKYFRK